jgi:hypothetical protein
VHWSWLTKLKEAGESTRHYHDREEAARHLEEICQGLEDGGLSLATTVVSGHPQRRRATLKTRDKTVGTIEFSWYPELASDEPSSRDVARLVRFVTNGMNSSLYSPPGLLPPIDLDFSAGTGQRAVMSIHDHRAIGLSDDIIVSVYVWRVPY